MKLVKTCFISLVLFSLVSCNHDSYIFDSSIISSESSSENNSIKREDKQKNLELKDNYLTNLYGGINRLPSIGKSKIFVVPVTFSDFIIPSSKQNEIKDHLNKTFFGDSNQTSWESVSSFYSKSSYQQLNITGEVSDVYKAKNNLSYYINQARNYPVYSSNSILKEVYDYFFASNKYKISDFDSDQDGVIDCVELIYLYPQYGYEGTFPSYITNRNLGSTDKGNLLWAYTYWYCGYDGYESKEDLVKYKALGDYVWASYFFTNGSGEDKIDAHTYIHETGHALGLDDYYDGNSLTSPAGAVTMMANNICDLDPYSKYFLGWTSPYKFSNNDFSDEKNEYTITLKPFESSGDSLILATDSNNTPFDEYYILDYYTPTFLNEEDSLNEYPGNGLHGFDKSGIRVYKINSKLVKSDITFSEVSDVLDYDNITWNYSNGDFNMIYASNTSYKYSTSRDNPDLIKLISSLGEDRSNKFTTPSYTGGTVVGDSKDLFQEGDTHLNDYFFDDGSLLKYSVEITNLSEESATLTLRYTD